MTLDPVAVLVDPEVLARALDRHPEYRVLRRVRGMDRRLPHGAHPGGLVGLALDTETTGRDHVRHEIIEVAMRRFVVDDLGRIVETGRMRSWFEQPREPIPAVITRVTGLTDADVAGRSIADGEATALLLNSDFVVAHNSSFDRPFVEKRLPLGAGRPWLCSLRDMDWDEQGADWKDLSALLCRAGWVYDAHRAATDVEALLRLLDHPLDDGGTVLRRLLRNGARPSWIVDAVDAPFSAREVLRDRGYRWDARLKLWSAEVSDEAVEGEIAWARMMLYGGRRDPAARRIDWAERYAART